MPGETDLRALLAGMTPTLRPEVYVFCTLPPGETLPGEIVPFATVREDEGLTVVIERCKTSRLGKTMRCSAPFRAITLTVHSSLNAVGFMAAVAGALANVGIPANVIAGYHHDHVLVTAGRADAALRALFLLSKFN